MAKVVVKVGGMVLDAFNEAVVARQEHYECVGHTYNRVSRET